MVGSPSFVLKGLPVMTLKQTLAALKKAGTAQNRKVFINHGVGQNLYGVSYAELGKLSKSIGMDHDLALGLWASGVHDARVLATFVANPKKLTARGLDGWAKDLDNYVLTGALAGLVARSNLAQRKFEVWKNRKNEWIAAAAWDVMSELCAQEYNDGLENGSLTLKDDYCQEQIEIICAQIHFQPNRVRHCMNQALISLGVRNEKAHTAALKVASVIGKVTVDHGPTGCKTPDAGSYMAKTMAHRINKKKKMEKALRGRNEAR